MHQFIIQTNQTIKKEFIQLTESIIDQTIQQIKNNTLTFENSCHDARKDIKKIRALLRAFRFSVQKQDFYREDRFLREIKNSLTEVRQADVFILIIENLHKKYLISEDNYVKIKDVLLQNKKRFFDRQVEIKNTIIRQLDIARIRLKNIDFITNNNKALLKGIRFTYSRGCKLKEKCFINQNSELLHSLRKSVKYLYYQIEFITCNQSDALNLIIEDYRKISEILGYEHDLTELMGFIAANQINNQGKLLTAINNEHISAVNDFLQVENTVFQDAPEIFRQFLNKSYSGKL